MLLYPKLELQIDQISMVPVTVWIPNTNMSPGGSPDPRHHTKPSMVARVTNFNSDPIHSRATDPDNWPLEAIWARCHYGPGLQHRNPASLAPVRANLLDINMDTSSGPNWVFTGPSVTTEVMIINTEHHSCLKTKPYLLAAAQTQTFLWSWVAGRAFTSAHSLPHSPAWHQRWICIYPLQSTRPRNTK